MCAQTRPRFILSSERVLGGMEFEDGCLFLLLLSSQIMLLGLQFPFHVNSCMYIIRSIIKEK